MLQNASKEAKLARDWGYTYGHWRNTNDGAISYGGRCGTDRNRPQYKRHSKRVAQQSPTNVVTPRRQTTLPSPLICFNSFLYNSERKSAQQVWESEMKKDRRCVDTPGPECDEAVRMRTVLAVHHLDAAGITWWSNEVKKILGEPEAEPEVEVKLKAEAAKKGDSDSGSDSGSHSHSSKHSSNHSKSHGHGHGHGQ